MTTDSSRPVTEREWKLSLDSHIREHTLEAANRNNLAHLLDQIRLEAKAANDVRLEGMNEFRRQLDRQSATFVTTEKYDTASRAGADAIQAIGVEVDRRLRAIESILATFLTNDGFNREHKILTDRVGRIENKQSNMDGRMAVYSAVAAFTGALLTTGFGSVIYLIVHG